MRFVAALASLAVISAGLCLAKFLLGDFRAAFALAVLALVSGIYGLVRLAVEIEIAETHTPAELEAMRRRGQREPFDGPSSRD